MGASLPYFYVSAALPVAASESDSHYSLLLSSLMRHLRTSSSCLYVCQDYVVPYIQCHRVVTDGSRIDCRRG